MPHRGVPSEHRHRPLAGCLRDQRAPPAQPEVRPPSCAARAARPAAAARGERRLPGLHRAGRVPGRGQGAGLDGLIRSHIQHQGEVASYVFAGSEPGLMKQLFESKERPLYGSAVPMRLARLADVDIAAVCGRAISPAVGGRRGAEPAPGGGEGASAAGDAARAPAVGGGEKGRRALTIGTAPTRRRWPSSSPEFDAQWRASTPPSRRPCGR